jgi:hypothetical protein
LIIAKATELALAGNVNAMKLLLDLKVLVPQSEESKDDRRLLELLSADQRACIELALKGEKAPRDLALDAWAR